MYELLATDFEGQHDDPDLYPGKMSDEDLKTLPMTVVHTSEFDFVRRETLAIKDRLKAVGKLQDFEDIPNGGHWFRYLNPED